MISSQLRLEPVVARFHRQHGAIALPCEWRKDPEAYEEARARLAVTIAAAPNAPGRK
ncbi:MAG TPA: hypothetical protein P5555_05075 [Candidatus Paceibacterota bacterium]|nr:hypothetical protein [Verrucomicrobiota bacterium]HRZ44544.1 hypothetical protein [Candidatus Paceibacterota bacterium]